MKALGFPIKSSHVSGIIRTYSTAVSKDFVPEHLVKLYVQDGWDLFNKALALDGQSTGEVEKGGKKVERMVTTQVVNALLGLHVNALLVKDAEELVVPLFSQLGFEVNCNTYEVGWAKGL